MSLRDRKLYDEAAALFRRARDGYAETWGSDHPRSVYCSRAYAGLWSFLQERAALKEATCKKGNIFGDHYMLGAEQ
jgi:hypothetical protein